MSTKPKLVRFFSTGTTFLLLFSFIISKRTFMKILWLLLYFITNKEVFTIFYFRNWLTFRYKNLYSLLRWIFEKKIKWILGPLTFLCLNKFTKITNLLIQTIAVLVSKCDALGDLVSVTIWCLHGRSNTCECMLTLFSALMPFLSICMS